MMGRSERTRGLVVLRRRNCRALQTLRAGAPQTKRQLLPKSLIPKDSVSFGSGFALSDLVEPTVRLRLCVVEELMGSFRSVLISAAVVASTCVLLAGCGGGSGDVATAAATSPSGGTSSGGNGPSISGSPATSATVGNAYSFQP